MTQEQTEHYFDWAATSPQSKEILLESLQIALEKWGNPSSANSCGKEAREVLENARKQCALTMGVKPENLYFTSGGTESDHIPLLSIINKPQKGTVLLSSIEHPAVREMALELKKCGFNVKQVDPDKNGIITSENIKKSLTDDTLIICVMAVNNETGAIQPIYEIADTITEFYKGKRKPKFHVDCVQAAGKIPLNLNYPGLDSAAFSAHKISGPRGIGLLYMKDAIEPFLKGGGQEKGIRSGTENVFGAISFSKVLQKYYLNEKNNEANENYQKQKEITKDFVKKLSKIKGATIIPENRIVNPDNYSAYVVQVSFQKLPGQVLLRALDAEGFYISTGSACSARKNNRPILDAMKIPKEISENAVRISFGPLTTKKAIDELYEKISEIVKKFNP